MKYERNDSILNFEVRQRGIFAKCQPTLKGIGLQYGRLSICPLGREVSVLLRFDIGGRPFFRCVISTCPLRGITNGLIVSCPIHKVNSVGNVPRVAYTFLGSLFLVLQLVLTEHLEVICLDAVVDSFSS